MSRKKFLIWLVAKYLQASWFHIDFHIHPLTTSRCPGNGGSSQGALRMSIQIQWTSIHGKATGQTSANLGTSMHKLNSSIAKHAVALQNSVTKCTLNTGMKLNKFLVCFDVFVFLALFIPKCFLRFPCVSFICLDSFAFWVCVVKLFVC